MISKLNDYLKDYAKKTPSKIALADRKNVVSYSDFYHLVNKLAYLLTKYVLDENTEIGISIPKNINLPIVYLGVFRCGFSAIPLEVNISQSKLLIIGKVTRMKYIIKFINEKLVLYRLDSKLDVIEEFELNFKDIELDIKEYIECEEEQSRYFNLTSGSTGTPKIFSTKTTQVVYNAINVNLSLPIELNGSYMCLFSESMHPHELFVKPLVAGECCVLCTTNEYQHINELIERFNIKSLLATPNLYKYLMSIIKKENWNNIKHLQVGGEKVEYQFRETFFNTTGKKLISAWGSTETTGIVFYTPIEWALSKKVVLGACIGGYKCKISSEGELLIKGYACIEQYYNSEEIIVDNEGYYNTGDLVYKDDNEIFYYEGRKDNQVKVGGRFISLFQLEQELLTVQAIKEITIEVSSSNDNIVIFLVVTSEFNELEFRKLGMSTQN